MKNSLLLLTSACIVVSILFSSCATNKHTTPSRNIATTKKDNSPQFIDSVYLKGHNTRGAAYNHELYKKPTGIASINTIPPTGKPKTVTQTATPEPRFITYISHDTQEAAASQPGNKNTAMADEPVKENEHMPAEWIDALVDESDPLVSKYAAMIAMDPKKITNYPLYHFVDDWYGTSYKWGGNDMDGIDCSGFSQKLYEDIYGIDLLRTVREQRRSCDRIRHEEDVVQGDLVFFRIRRFRVSHVGIYLANGYFVHASSSHGVVISNLNDKYWHRRFAGYGRIEKDNAVSESDYTP